MPLGQKTDDILTFFQVDPCCSFNSKFKKCYSQNSTFIKFLLHSKTSTDKHDCLFFSKTY